jgi:GNAT superfamily N-acetyltransferase
MTTISSDADAFARAQASDRAEAMAFADVFDAAPAPLRDQLGLERRTIAGATLLMAPRVPTSMLNRAIGLGMGLDGTAHAATLADAEAIAEAFRAAGATSWWLHWNPPGRPAGFEADLRAHGWTPPPRRSWAKMLRDTTPPPRFETSLEIDLVRADELGPATQAIARAFEMPPFMGEWLAALHGRPRWRIYVARDGAQPVGGGCVFIDGSLAWLGMGAVLPSHRRRGGHAALMARRIADAIAAGATAIATETGEPVADEPNPSLENMRRCGFACVASRLNFVAPAGREG